MSLFRSLPISMRIAAAVATLPTVGAVVVGLGLPSWVDGAARESYAQRAEIEAQLLSASLAPALEFQDPEFIALTLERLDSDPEAMSATVRDASGRVLGRWARPERPIQDAYHLQLRSEIPAPSGAGSLDLVVDAATLRQSHQTTIRMAWAAGLVLFAIGVLFSLLLGHLLGRRLRRLAFAADRIADGSLSKARGLLAVDAVHGRQGSRDEISQLAASLYAMAHELDRYHASQRDQQRMLEERIAAQTSHLEDALSAAQQASAAKSAFLATMSHELRTPMNGVLGAAQLLQQLDLQGEDQELLAVLIRSGQAMLGLIDQVLDVSRIEAGRVSLDAVDFDLAELVADSVTLLQGQARNQDLSLDLELSGGAWTAVRGDANRLRQVLVNLLGNALKFTEQGGVRLVCRPLAIVAGRTRVRLEVHDTGPGIPADARDAIFETFRQADDSTTRRFGGSGLGLALCRQVVVDLMGGRIGVESEVGVGSTFWVEIELQAAAPAADDGACETESMREAS